MGSDTPLPYPPPLPKLQAASMLGHRHPHDIGAQACNWLICPTVAATIGRFSVLVHASGPNRCITAYQNERHANLPGHPTLMGDS